MIRSPQGRSEFKATPATFQNSEVDTPGRALSTSVNGVNRNNNGKRTDGDYGISYIRREGQGRVYVNVLGHDHGIYTMPAMLEHPTCRATHTVHRQRTLAKPHAA